jgi:AbrB family looped-hinge helix DNA binding protein
MTTLVKIHRKGQMTLPSSFRAAMGVSEGSVVELSLKNGKAVITPKVVIDRSQFPNAGEYTPAQRRIIDRGIAQSMKEYRQGRFSGPFETVEEFLADLHKANAKLAAKKPKRASK